MSVQNPITPNPTHTPRFWLLLGASGSGKSTLATYLKEKHHFTRLISHTTREPREGEVDGVDYHFVTPEVFDQIQFSENVPYTKNRYGVSVHEIETKWKGTQDVLAVLNRAGCEAIKAMYPHDVQVIYVHIDEATLVERLKCRNETQAVIDERLAHAKKHHEFDNQDLADYVIDNRGTLEDGIAQLEAILQQTKLNAA